MVIIIGGSSEFVIISNPVYKMKILVTCFTTFFVLSSKQQIGSSMINPLFCGGLLFWSCITLCLAFHRRQGIAYSCVNTFMWLNVAFHRSQYIFLFSLLGGTSWCFISLVQAKHLIMVSTNHSIFSYPWLSSQMQSNHYLLPLFFFIIWLFPCTERHK